MVVMALVSWSVVTCRSTKPLSGADLASESAMSESTGQWRLVADGFGVLVEHGPGPFDVVDHGLGCRGGRGWLEALGTVESVAGSVGGGRIRRSCDGSDQSVSGASAPSRRLTARGRAPRSPLRSGTRGTACNDGCEAKAVIAVEEDEGPALELSATIDSDNTPGCENCRSAETSGYGKTAGL